MDLLDLPGNPVPAGAVLVPLKTSDGLMLRAVRWPAPEEGRKGTVCLFTGWNEQIEKYFTVVEELRRRGFAVATMDWRGQGGSQRLLKNPRRGYVRSFRHYARDLDAFRKQLVLPDCPPPYFGLAHSMGGHVLLAESPRLTPWLERLVLSAPFLGLSDRELPQGTARLITGAACLLGLGWCYAPGQAARAARARSAETSVLTSDPARVALMREIAAARPDLGLSGPTLRWVRAAIAGMDRMNAPDFAAQVPMPVMLVNCGADEVVSRQAIETMARRLRNPAYILIPGARHEVMLERPVFAAQFWAAFDAFIPGSPA